MKRIQAAALCAMLSTSAWSARAVAQGHSPGVWERAASPDRARADSVHREVEVLLVAAAQLHWYTPMGQEQLNKAMQTLVEVGADRSPDVRLRFDFGRVAENLRDYRKAEPALAGALAEAPDHALATRAYFSLGICYAKLDRAEDEIAAYDEYLARETDETDRALALSNRAEAQMLLNRLPQAITDYRASILLEPAFTLAHWGLAVALDRNGDTPGAMLEAKIAFTYDPLDQKLTGPDVFFMPSYDKYWYEAIGAMARAQQVDDAATAILWWETAVAKWASYVAIAASDDRWLALAKAHEVSSQRSLDQAKKKAAKQPKPNRPRADQALR